MTARPRSTEFDNRVELIRDRDGISKTEAMSRAREEFPDDFRDISASIPMIQYLCPTPAKKAGSTLPFLVKR